MYSMALNFCSVSFCNFHNNQIITKYLIQKFRSVDVYCHVLMPLDDLAEIIQVF